MTMRGDSIPRPDGSSADGAVMVPTRRKNRVVAANIVDPASGEVYYHVVPTKYLNIMIASIVTLLLCGLVVLGLVIYLKTDIDQNRHRIDQMEAPK